MIEQVWTVSEEAVTVTLRITGENARRIAFTHAVWGDNMRNGLEAIFGCKPSEDDVIGEFLTHEDLLAEWVLVRWLRGIGVDTSAVDIVGTRDGFIEDVMAWLINWFEDTPLSDSARAALEMEAERALRVARQCDTRELLAGGRFIREHAAELAWNIGFGYEALETGLRALCAGEP